MEKIGALWIRQGKKQKFLSGEIDNRKVIIFKNNRKKSEKHPDYIVYLSEDKKKETSNNEPDFYAEDEIF